MTIPAFAYGPAAGLSTAFLRGCADYLRKPWSPAELEYRATRWLEAAGLTDTHSAAAGQTRLAGHTLHGPMGTCALSAQEARVALALMQHQGRVVSRVALFYRLWGRVPPHASRAVDVHVAALRKKLTRVGAEPPPLTTARGLGYLWTEPTQRD